MRRASRMALVSFHHGNISCNTHLLEVSQRGTSNEYPKNKPASVAQLDVRPAGYQEVAGLTPAGSATFFHGDWLRNSFYGHYLLITFANSLDPDRARQNLGPDLDQTNWHHKSYIIIIGFLINVQVQGQHPHQWAPFQIAGLLHAWHISHQISRYVYHEGW